MPAVLDNLESLPPPIVPATTGYVYWGGSGYAVQTPSGGLLPANNLSDVASASTARTNLGLGTAATAAASSFAAASHTHAASAITSGQLALARGGTNADLSATGGSTSFLRQASAGAAITVGPIAVGDLPTVDVVHGGTGLTTIANGSVLYATSLDTLAAGTPDTAGLVDKASTQTVAGAKTFSSDLIAAGRLQVGMTGAPAQPFYVKIGSVGGSFVNPAAVTFSDNVAVSMHLFGRTAEMQWRTNVALGFATANSSTSCFTLDTSGNAAFTGALKVGTGTTHSTNAGDLMVSRGGSTGAIYLGGSSGLIYNNGSAISFGLPLSLTLGNVNTASVAGTSAGQAVWDSILGHFYGWNGSAWKQLDN